VYTEQNKETTKKLRMLNVKFTKLLGKKPMAIKVKGGKLMGVMMGKISGMIHPHIGSMLVGCKHHPL
jgi:hypothetical protein